MKEKEIDNINQDYVNKEIKKIVKHIFMEIKLKDKEIDRLKRISDNRFYAEKCGVLISKNFISRQKVQEIIDSLPTFRLGTIFKKDLKQKLKLKETKRK